MTPGSEVDGDFDDALDAVRQAAQRRAMEALQDVFHRLPMGQRWTLADGVEVELQPWMQPKVMERPAGSEDALHGRPCAGVDVRAVDGSWHIEFIVYQSGFGGTPPATSEGSTRNTTTAPEAS